MPGKAIIYLLYRETVSRRACKSVKTDYLNGRRCQRGSSEEKAPRPAWGIWLPEGMPFPGEAADVDA